MAIGWRNEASKKMAWLNVARRRLGEALKK